MAFLFRKTRQKEAVNPNIVIDRLRQTLELLEKRESYLHKRAENELIEAKKQAIRNKKGTLITKIGCFFLAWARCLTSYASQK
jgi:charged multivesicular body protein 4